MTDLTIFNTFIFDCDGVVMNSNNIKSQAFYDVTIKYGKEIAEEFVEYHRLNGGVSRYEKFKYFAKTMLGSNHSGLEKEALINQLLQSYSEQVSQRLMSAEISASIKCFSELYPDS